MTVCHPEECVPFEGELSFFRYVILADVFGFFFGRIYFDDELIFVCWNTVLDLKVSGMRGFLKTGVYFFLNSVQIDGLINKFYC